MKKEEKKSKSVRLQVQLDPEIMRALRRRAADELKTVRKLIIEWVQSWSKEKK